MLNELKTNWVRVREKTHNRTLPSREITVEKLTSRFDWRQTQLDCTACAADILLSIERRGPSSYSNLLARLLGEHGRIEIELALRQLEGEWLIEQQECGRFGLVHDFGI